MGIFDAMNATCQAAFGSSYLLIRSGEPNAEIQGVFDRRHIDVEVDGQIASLMVATLTVQTVDAGRAERGSRVLIGRTRYEIQDIRPDAEGMTILVLERV
jgi:hypothetical protein